MAEHVAPAATVSTDGETPPPPTFIPANGAAQAVRVTRARRAGTVPYPASRPPRRKQAHANGSRLDTEMDELLVDAAISLSPFLERKGKQLAAWAQLLDVVRDSGIQIDTPRGVMLHFKYLCEVVSRPTHKHHDTIQGDLRDKLLQCVEKMKKKDVVRGIVEHPRQTKPRITTAPGAHEIEGDGNVRGVTRREEVAAERPQGASVHHDAMLRLREQVVETAGRAQMAMLSLCAKALDESDNHEELEQAQEQ